MLNMINQEYRQQSKIPILVSRQKVIVTPSKLEKNKIHRLYQTTCSRKAQEEKNFHHRTVEKKVAGKAYSFQKPQDIQLKEDIEKLRKKTSKDEFIIKQQQDEILKLKKLVSHKRKIKRQEMVVQLQLEIEKELIEKCKLQTKLSLAIAEKQKLNTQLIDLLEVKSYPAIDQDVQRLEQLQTQLQKNRDDFQRKVREYKDLLLQKETCLQQQQTKKEQLLSQHKLQILRIQQDHSKIVKSLELERKPQINQFLLEQLLRDFEQEQHHHLPEPKMTPPLTFKTGHSVNQQWYSQKYIPFDAMSWPTPVYPFHLKKTTISN